LAHIFYIFFFRLHVGKQNIHSFIHSLRTAFEGPESNRSFCRRFTSDAEAGYLTELIKSTLLSDRDVRPFTHIQTVSDTVHSAPP